MQTIGRKDALDIITSSLGFSIEAHIPSRSWLLCGQSDVEYYAPNLNRNVKAHWSILSPEELIPCALEENAKGYPLIVETEARLIPYYNQSALGTGMPHAFLIFAYDSDSHRFSIYDRLAPDESFAKDQQRRFWVDAQILEAAFYQKLLHLKYTCGNPQISCEEEILQLCQKSIENMQKEVSRAHENYQAFGFQGLKIFSEALRHFREAYHDDAQSIWLLNHYLPVNILQSVYGNRLLFRKRLEKADFSLSIIEALDDSLNQWTNLRRAFVECADGIKNYVQLADQLHTILNSEKKLVTLLEERCQIVEKAL